MQLKKPSELVSGCFRSPFKGLLILIWIYFVWSYLLHPFSPILKGHFYDSDDYTYLQHTLDWIKGQGWFDTIQHRMNPPDGVPIHFSRITEIPIAAFILFWHEIGFNWEHAAAATAAFWPLFLFAFFLLGLRWVADEYLPRDWVRATAFPALFATSLTFQFSPGRIDHHGVGALVILLAFGATIRFLVKPSRLGTAALAGFLLALSQVIALENLPYLIAMSAFVGLWMIFRGKEMALPGALFGATLFAASAGFVIATKTPDMWFDEDLLAFSGAYAELAFQIGLCCVVVGVASLVFRSVWGRLIVGLAILGATGSAFFWRFPELLEGPYGGANKELTKLFFTNISEAIPYYAKFQESNEALFKPLFPLLGFLACLRFALQARSDRDVLRWFFNLILLGVPLFLMIFYQARFIHYAQLFAIIPITAMLRQGLMAAEARWRGHKLSAIQLLLILSAGPLPCVLLPALIDNRAFNRGVVLFPADTLPSRACWDDPLHQMIAMPPYTDGKPLLIMNTIDQGAELLFRTPHNVVAGPYHTNVSGIMDSLRFFSSQNEAESEQVIREIGADLVVLCSNQTDIYLKDPRPNLVKEGQKKDDPEAKEPPTLAKRLIDNDVPPWLKKVDYPLHGNLLLFKVLPPEPPKTEAPPEETPPETLPQEGTVQQEGQTQQEGLPSPEAPEQLPAPLPETAPPVEPKTQEPESFGKVTGPSDLPSAKEPDPENQEKARKDKTKTMPAPDDSVGIKIP